MEILIHIKENKGLNKTELTNCLLNLLKPLSFLAVIII
jgi:hypothetical protein